MGLRANKTVTEKEYEQSQSSYKAMKERETKLKNNLKLMKDGPRIERIDMARAEVQQAEADLSKAEWRLSNCTITAPISGVVSSVATQQGETVAAGLTDGRHLLR